MLYIFFCIVYLICGIYLLFKNNMNNIDIDEEDVDGKKVKNKKNKKNKKNIDSNTYLSQKSNDHNKIFSIFVFIFSLIMGLQYILINNTNENNNSHTISLVLFLTLYLFAVLPNLLLYAIFNNYIIKFKFVSLATGLYTIITCYLIYALNKYQLVSGLNENNSMCWGAIKALTTNHLPMFIIFSLFSGFLFSILLINLFITKTLLVNPIRYIFLIVSASIASIITYFSEVKLGSIFELPFNIHKYLDTYIPLSILIGSFSSILAVFGL